MTAPTLESHGFTLDFSQPLLHVPHWTRVAQTILTWEREPRIAGFDHRFRRMHNMVRCYGPMLRYELNLLVHYCPELNSDGKVATLVAHYVCLMRKADAIGTYQPRQFIEEFPPENPGVTFHPQGGYCIIDEYGSRFGKWRTADDAFHAHRNRYLHIPGIENIPNKELLP